jgi:hypothetical protein
MKLMVIFNIFKKLKIKIMENIFRILSITATCFMIISLFKGQIDYATLFAVLAHSFNYDADQEIIKKIIKKK